MKMGPEFRVVTPIGAVSRATTTVKCWAFVHAKLVAGQRVKGKIHQDQVVKAIFQQSKILTMIAALDTVPMQGRTQDSI